MLTKKLTSGVCITLLSLCASLHAQEQMRPQSSILTNVDVPPTILSERPSAQQPTPLNDEQLLANPALFTQVLDQAVEQSRWDIVRHLLPLYASLTDKDPVLYQYAQARLSHFRGSYAVAIDRYQNLLTQYPELTPVRLYAAQALFENKQFSRARTEFERVRVDNPPEPVLRTVAQYLAAIEQVDDGYANGSVNYLSDKNINNTSRDTHIDGHPDWVRPPDSLPQYGRGVQYFGAVGKNFSLSDQHMATVGINAMGKTYWNHHDFDDLTLRGSVGYRYQTARVSVAVSPFASKRDFGNVSYNATLGTRLDASYVLTPIWQISGAWEWGRNDYATREFLDGRYHFLSAGANYFANPKTQWFANVDVLNDMTRDRSETSRKWSGRVGVVRALPYSLSVQAQIGYARRVFDDVPNLFGVHRRDAEYTAALSVWHRAWSLWGITPRLNYELQKTDSNININRYQKQRVYVSMTRGF